MAACYRCGAEFPRDLVVTRSLECPSCSAPVRCCKNCTFYEVGAHWDCRETIPDPVFDKERSNFCDYFRLADRSGTTGGISGDNDPGSRARHDFDSLFS
jgi:DNA-directed RNA polymerase subunit RPC12/RpoP